MLIHSLAYLTSWLRTVLRNEDGQSMVEYGILIALVALVAVGAVAAVGTGVFNAFTDAAGELPAGGA